MGWWEQNEEGDSLSGHDRDPEPYYWGDGPADVIDDALWKIKAQFIKDLGRLPSIGEIMAGITFSTRVLNLPDRPEESPSATEDQVKAVDDGYYAATRGNESIPARTINASAKISEVIRDLEKPFKKDDES